jgi:hypothetical protein
LGAFLRDRYPAEDVPDLEFPTQAEGFLMPDGVEVVMQDPGRTQRFFTFIHNPGSG